jgi:uncharacterized protein (DUF433 family)
MTLPDFLVEWPHGEIMIAGHRIGLYHVVRRYKDGMTAEQLAEWYPTLERDLVQKVIDFYHANQSEVDAYVAEEEAGMERNRAAAAPGRLNMEDLRRRYAEKKRGERG